MNRLNIRALREADCEAIHQAFVAQGWKKPVAQYYQYLDYQSKGVRDILVATFEEEFAGYLTINWISHYPPFKTQGIPEIVDFNVLIKFQRKGIGTVLMDEAEARIKRVSSYAGIGFGVPKDYGAAQVLYIKRGYIPDGQGMLLDGKPLPYGAQVEISDDLVFFCLNVYETVNLLRLNIFYRRN